MKSLNKVTTRKRTEANSSFAVFGPTLYPRHFGIRSSFDSTRVCGAAQQRSKKRFEPPEEKIRANFFLLIWQRKKNSSILRQKIRNSKNILKGILPLLRLFDHLLPYCFCKAIVRSLDMILGPPSC